MPLRSCFLSSFPEPEASLLFLRSPGARLNHSVNCGPDPGPTVLSDYLGCASILQAVMTRESYILWMPPADKAAPPLRYEKRPMAWCPVMAQW